MLYSEFGANRTANLAFPLYSISSHLPTTFAQDCLSSQNVCWEKGSLDSHLWHNDI